MSARAAHRAPAGSRPAPAATGSGRSARRFRAIAVAVLLGAATWRLVLLLQMPVLARDGVTFCWLARDLGNQGVAHLRAAEVQQHPLFPLLILAVQRGATTCGAPDTPLTWQHSGQAVALLSGLAVIALSGALAYQLVLRLALPLAARLTALLAMALAAMLDMNVWLSIDVMSDQLHAALYLAAVLLLLNLATLWRALSCGLLAGLAFTTRPEGVLPLLAAFVALRQAAGHPPGHRLWMRAAVAALGFAVVAAPYLGAAGRLFPKKNPFDWETSAARLQTPAPPCRCTPVTAPPGSERLLLAKLETRRVPWYALLPEVLYKLFRAGRVIVPLLAIPPLLSLRRRFGRPELAGWLTCLLGHLALTVLLLHRYGYLDPRHMLIPVLLLTPLAAMLLGRVVSLVLDLRGRVTAAVLIALALLPGAWPALRVPNGHDAYLRAAAAGLTARHAAAPERLLSGSSGRRVAFYADLAWQHWPEEPQAYEALAGQIRTNGPGWFLLEVGSGFERAGNADLSRRLEADAALAPWLGRPEVLPGPDPQTQVRLYPIRKAGPSRSRAIAHPRSVFGRASARRPHSIPACTRCPPAGKWSARSSGATSRTTAYLSSPCGRRASSAVRRAPRASRPRATSSTSRHPATPSGAATVRANAAARLNLGRRAGSARCWTIWRVIRPAFPTPTCAASPSTRPAPGAISGGTSV